jgi:hypothetical protein
MNREESEKKIAAAMAHVHPKRLESHVVKTKRLTFHLLDEEFEEIRNAAESLDMSIADYLFALHRHAVKRLDVSATDSEWVHRSPRNRDDEQE